MTLQPMTTAALLYAVVSWRFAGGQDALVYFLISFAFISGGPAFLILSLAHWKVISDSDLTDRRERSLPYFILVGMYLVSFGLYRFFGAPTPLLGITASYVLVTLTGAMISFIWKISMHLAGIAGPVTALVVYVHPLFALGYLLLLPVGWARLTLRKHTLSQVVCGSLYSAILTLAITVFLF